MNGIVAYAAYIPYFRLDRKAIAAALGQPAGKGTRAVASYDEDTTSMGVEAARAALRGAPALRPAGLYFATAAPGYLDKTNATAIHAALDLDPATAAFDMLGSVRSGAGALRAAVDAARPTLAGLSDIRTGLPGGAPGQWEERFGEHAYAPLGGAAVTEALKQAGITAQALDRLIVAGPHARACKRVAASVGAPPAAVADDLGAVIGNTGTAHAGLLLADTLDRAAPDQLIAVVSLADGCDVTIWRTAAALGTRRANPTVAQQIAGGTGVPYAAFLTWRGFLDREPPRRPDPQRPAAPPAFRRGAWKVALTGSHCHAFGAPP